MASNWGPWGTPPAGQGLTAQALATGPLSGQQLPIPQGYPVNTNPAVPPAGQATTSAWGPWGTPAATGVSVPPAGQTTAFPPPVPSGASGFLHNVLSGVEGIVTGVGSLGGMLLHDVGKGLSEVATLGKADVLGGYESKALAAAPAALWHDVATRYGPLFHGDIKGFAHQMYQNPVAFASDALAALSLGGSVAGEAASITARSLPAVEGLGEVSNLVAKTGQAGKLIDQLSSVAGRLGEARAAGDVEAITARASELEALQSKLPQWVKDTLPGLQSETPWFPGGTTQRFIGETGTGGEPFQTVPLVKNPWRRFTYERVWRPLLTEPLSAAESRLGSLRFTADEQALARSQKILDTAREFGMARVDRPFMQRVLARKAFDHLVGAISSRNYALREQARADYMTSLTHLAADGPEAVDRANVAFQGLHDGVMDPLGVPAVSEDGTSAAAAQDAAGGRLAPEVAAERLAGQQRLLEENARVRGRRQVPDVPFQQVTPEEFASVREAVPEKYRPYISFHDPQHMAENGWRTFLSGDKRTGFAVTGDGEIANVFALPGAPRGAGAAAVIEGIGQGGTRVEHFSGHLSGYYQRFGFQPAQVFPFDEGMLRADYPDIATTAPELLQRRPGYVVSPLHEALRANPDAARTSFERSFAPTAAGAATAAPAAVATPAPAAGARLGVGGPALRTLDRPAALEAAHAAQPLEPAVLRDPEIAAAYDAATPARARWRQQWMDTVAPRLGLSGDEAQLGFERFDAMARRAVQQAPKTFPDMESFYGRERVQFAQHFLGAGVHGEHLKVVEGDPDWNRMLTWARQGERSPVRWWYQNSRRAIPQMAKIFGTQTMVLGDGVTNARLSDLLTQLIASTTQRATPERNMMNAVSLLHRAQQEIAKLPMDAAAADKEAAIGRALGASSAMESSLGAVTDVLMGTRRAGDMAPDLQRVIDGELRMSKASALTQRLYKLGYRPDDVLDTSARGWEGLYSKPALRRGAPRGYLPPDEERIKMLSFYKNLTGQYNRVTVDTWIGRLFDGRGFEFTGQAIKGPRYREIEGQVQRMTDILNDEVRARIEGEVGAGNEAEVARRLAAERWRPAEVQAILWDGIKRDTSGILTADGRTLRQAQTLALKGDIAGAQQLLSGIQNVESKFKDGLPAFVGDRKAYAQALQDTAKDTYRRAASLRDASSFEGLLQQMPGVQQVGKPRALARILNEVYQANNTGELLPKVVRGNVVGAFRPAAEFGGLITLFKGGDLTVLAHEQGHLLQYLMGAVPEDLRAIESHMGVANGAWTRGAQERFADLVEQYFTTGFAPQAVRGPFQRLRAALGAMWHHLRGDFTDRQMVSPPMRDLFDRWLGPGADPPNLEATITRTGAIPDAATAARVGEPAAAAPRLIVPEISRSIDESYRDALLTPGSNGIAGRRYAFDLAAEQTVPQGSLRQPDWVNAADATARLDQEDASLTQDMAKQYATQLVSHRVKPADRIAAQVARLQQVTPNATAADLADLLGARVALTEWHGADAEVAKLSALGDVVGVQNFVREPMDNGWRGIVAYVRRPSGAIAQIQFQTPTAIRMNDAIDRVQRLIEDMPEQIRRAEQGKASNVFSGDLAPARQWYAKARAYQRSLSEPVVQELDEQLNNATISGTARAQEGVRWANEKWLTAPMFDSHVLDPAEAFDRAYLPLRLSSGATWDPALKDFVSGADSLSLHEARSRAGLATPVYFPHFDASKIKFSDWLMSRKAVGAMKAVEPGYTKRNVGYLFERGKYVADPLDAYSRRATAAIRYQETFNLTREVARRYGRAITDPSQVHPGERLFSPDAILRFFNGRITFEQALLKGLEGVSQDRVDAIEQSIADALKTTVEDAQKQIVGQFVGVAKNRGLYAIPDTVAKRLEATYRPLLGPNARLFWDAPTNVWRGFVLAGSPRWVVNNVLGNIMFLKLQGGHLRDVVRLLDPRFRRMVDELIPADVREKINTGFFSMNEQYNVRLGAAGETKVGRAYQAIGTSRGVLGARKVGTFMRTLNGHIEDLFREASYLKAADRVAIDANLRRAGLDFWRSKQRLEAISKVGVSPHLADAAVREMNYFMNDYTVMSPLERQVVRRFVFPFWSFYRHVGRLLLTLPFTHPERFVALRELSNLGNEMSAEYGPLPEWLRGTVAIGPGDMPGETMFLNTGGPNPFNALFGTPLAMLHPWLRVAIEQLSGRKTSSGLQTEFSAPDVVQPFGASQKYRVTSSGIQPSGVVHPGLFESLLRQLPQYQLLEDAVAGGEYYDTATLPQLLKARLGGWQPGQLSPIKVDPATGQPQYPINLAQQFERFAGFSTTSYGLQSYQQRLSTEEAAAYREYLQRVGLLPTSAQAQVGGTGV